VLEVNEDRDFGTTIDVVLINGALRKGDQIVVCTKQVCSSLLLKIQNAALNVASSDFRTFSFSSAGACHNQHKIFVDTLSHERTES